MSCISTHRTVGGEHFNSTAVQGTRQVYYGHTRASRRRTVDGRRRPLQSGVGTNLTHVGRPHTCRVGFVKRSGVRPVVCMSRRSMAAAAVGGFAAKRRRHHHHHHGHFLSKQQNCKDHWCLQVISIDSCGRRAANAGSVMLRADGGGSTRTWKRTDFIFIFLANTVG